MKKLIGIFGSILITILIIGGAGVALTVVFKDRVPILEEVPEPKVYEALNRKEYVVATNGIEDARNATVVYESTDWELEKYGQELRYISGKIEPLTSTGDPAITSDIPTDVFPKEVKTTAPVATVTEDIASDSATKTSN